MKGLPEGITLDVMDFLSKWGLQGIVKAGKEIHCECPFHDDSKPSLYINSESGLWHCFGCDAKGNIITLVKRLDECDNTQALQRILQFATELDVTQIKEILKIKLSLESKQEEQKYFNYKAYLKDVKPADRYMRKERNISDVVLLAAGIGYDPEMDAVVIPVFNDQHKAVCLIRRLLHRKQYRYSYGVKVHDYIYRVTHKPTAVAIVVEGPIDCLRVQSALLKLGLHHEATAIAILGSKVSSSQLTKIAREYASIYLMLDNDDSGKFGRDYYISQHRQMGFENPIYITKIPEGIKDPGGMTDEQIRQAIQQRQSLLKFNNSSLKV